MCTVGKGREEGVREDFTDLRSVTNEQGVRESWGLPRQRDENIKGLGLFKA